MIGYAEILARRVPVPPGMQCTRHRLPAGEPRQFGDLTLTLMAEIEDDTGRVRMRYHPVVSGEALDPCAVQLLPVPGITDAVLIPRVAVWSLEAGRSLPSILLELHQPYRVMEAQA